MPTIRLSKSTIDGLPITAKDNVFWDESLPGFGVKVTPKGKKVFIALYRTGGAGSRLRKYTIGPYGRITLHGARSEAQKVFAARLDGRDPAAEKREGKRRLTIDRLEEVVELFDRQRLAANRSRREIRRLLDRVVVSAWRLALTGQRREEVARMTWSEIDLGAALWSLGSARTKNGRAHTVRLSDPSLTRLGSVPRLGTFVFTSSGDKPFQNFTPSKRRLDALSGVKGWRLHDLRRTTVSGMARLGVAPHVADRILNHVGGTISGVAAVYQRHEFLAERKAALDVWGDHVSRLAQQSRSRRGKNDDQQF